MLAAKESPKERESRVLENKQQFPSCENIFFNTHLSGHQTDREGEQQANRRTIFPTASWNGGPH